MLNLDQRRSSSNGKSQGALALAGFLGSLQVFPNDSESRQLRNSEVLSCLLLTVTVWPSNQISPKLFHLYGCFLYLLSIFVALPW